jgi:hypothetical protein
MQSGDRSFSGLTPPAGWPDPRRYDGHVRASFVVLLLAGCAGPTPWAPLPDAPRADAAAWSGDGSRVFGVPSGGPRTGPTGPSGCAARVLVVFDRSGSMAASWEDGSPRWRVAADALDAAIQPLASHLTVGAILFPSIESGVPGECAPVDPVEAQLPYDDGATFLAAWRVLWDSPAVSGSTPLDTAFDAASASLPTDDVVTAVVLLTDGEPTCRGPTPATTHAAAWLARGIRTFVIGLPGTAGSATLEAIAAAGGTGAPISPSDAASLTSGLRSFLGDVVVQACAE